MLEVNGNKIKKEDLSYMTKIWMSTMVGPNMGSLQKMSSKLFLISVKKTFKEFVREVVGGIVSGNG